MEKIFNGFSPNENSNGDPSFKDWIDGQDVMQTLHISQRTLQTLRSKGVLPYSRIGNKIFYLLKDVRKILSDNYIMLKLLNK